MIYFITQGSEYVKIGYTDVSVRDRLSMLQSGNPQLLRVCFEMKGSKELESELHEQFNDYHVRGEWFFLTGEIEKWIEDSDNHHIKTTHRVSVKLKGRRRYLCQA